MDTNGTTHTPTGSPIDMMALFDEMSLRDLRTAANKKAKENGLPTSQIVSWDRAACLRYIKTGETPNAQTQAAALDALKMLLGGGSSGPDLDTIRDIVRDEVAAIAPVKIELHSPGKVVKVEERQHYLFPLICAVVSTKLNICLTGPTGSGKTTALIAAAKALEIEVFLQNMSPTTSKADIFGFIDAAGTYRETAFYKAFKHGGLFIADEFDTCAPGVAVLMNAAIGNRMLTFPNAETIEAHPDFFFAIAMNTLGLGATAEYVGRNRLDAATLNRFVFLEVPYDLGLEASFAGVQEYPMEVKIGKGGILTPEKCLELVRKVRAAIAEAKLPHILSPRDVIAAIKLSAAGIGQHWIKKMILCRQMTPEQVKQVEKIAEGKSNE